jgi:DNA replication protein DnaC
MLMNVHKDKIYELCKQMRLSGNLADLILTTEAESNQEFFVKVFTEELKFRDAKRYEKLIKSAGFYSVKTLKGFITDEIQFPAGAGLDELASLDFVKEKFNVCMYGGTGTGKTMLSTALGVLACRQGLAVRFYRTAALVNSLSEAKAAGTLSKLLNRIEKASVLILDEFGYVPVDRVGAQLLFDVVSECCEKKSIILNTNLEFSNWVNILYDQKMTAALISRLLHHCHLLLFTGSDMRLKQSSINDMYTKMAG